MKILSAIILLGSLLIGHSAFAALDPQKVFFADAAVAQAITELKAQGFTREDLVTTSLLSASCGFAGCGNVLLVVATYSTEGANTQTRSVSAIVNVAPHGDTASVKIVDIH